MEMTKGNSRLCSLAGIKSAAGGQEARVEALWTVQPYKYITLSGGQKLIDKVILQSFNWENSLEESKTFSMLFWITQRNMLLLSLIKKKIKGWNILSHSIGQVVLPREELFTKKQSLVSTRLLTRSLLNEPYFLNSYTWTFLSFLLF